ncbi:Ran-binding-domain-containing protein [Viridothelium virens]|uniref:Ran-binding-domain-containing protein n=1 Tax=Viridothelium virens TaxID=1048519 RepID=A0A6A6HPE2_VIRVR|nr:Ran-binding-domain-containing protein [Viridothelium virens]
MDILLNKVTQQAMNYAIRSGITITSGYAIRHASRLLKTTPKCSERDELLRLQARLESKIRIISPAIDMIELIAARGNTTLESAVTLTKDIRWEIQNLGTRLSNAANEEELFRNGSSRAKPREQAELTLKLIISDIKKLLERIEDAVPLINLAITTSGVNLSTNLPSTVSPSRLLQASTFLTGGDAQYTTFPGHAIQIGPTYTLSMYMLFAGHAWRSQDEDSIRETTWKEVIHKARVKLLRVPLHQLYALPNSTPAGDISGHGLEDPQLSHIPGEAKAFEFAYQILLVEDLDDDRFHSFEDGESKPEPFEDVQLAGLRDVIPIHEISKIFYADTGKILNIGTEGEVNNPILLLKRDIHADPPRRMMERRRSVSSLHADSEVANGDEPPSETAVSNDEQSGLDAQVRRESSVASEKDDHQGEQRRDRWRLPPDLDPEWIAFEVYTEAPESEDEDTEPTTAVTESSPSRPRKSSRQPSIDPNITNALSQLQLSPQSPGSSPKPLAQQQSSLGPSAQSVGPGQVKTSLSLLEMLIRLTALQQFRQDSHLSIDDELLNFFLEDSSTTGAGPDAEQRQRVRRDARRRVGFDPYDESPVKRRGEEYIQHPPPEHFYGASPSAVGYDDRVDSGYAPPWSSVENEAPDVVSARATRLTEQRPYSSGMPSSPSPGYFSGSHRTSSRIGTPEHRQSFPTSPRTPPGAGTRSTMLAQEAGSATKLGSPLGRTMISSSPAKTSPTLAGSAAEGGAKNT